MSEHSSRNGSGAGRREPKLPRSGTGKQNLLVTLARYSEIAFLIPMSVVLGYVLGLLADHLLHTHWLYLAGIIFGAVAGFVSMIRQALGSEKAVEAVEAEERAEGESIPGTSAHERDNRSEGGSSVGGSDEEKDGSHEQR